MEQMIQPGNEVGIGCSDIFPFNFIKTFEIAFIIEGRNWFNY